MKRFLGCFATMLLVFAITDFGMGGSLLRPGYEKPEEMSAGVSSVNLTGKRIPEYEALEVETDEELGEIIAAESCAFVEAAFEGDRSRVFSMLHKGTEYKVAEDKSSYIRYISEDMLVEGYMATNRKLLQVHQCWHVSEDDGTITSGVEVKIEGEESVQTWYIHYRKVLGRWKIFMLENGI